MCPFVQDVEAHTAKDAKLPLLLLPAPFIISSSDHEDGPPPLATQQAARPAFLRLLGVFIYL